MYVSSMEKETKWEPAYSESNSKTLKLEHTHQLKKEK